VTLGIGMPKSEVGGARNLQWVQCNDWRIYIPGFKHAAITVLKSRTKIHGPFSQIRSQLQQQLCWRLKLWVSIAPRSVRWSWVHVLFHSYNLSTSAIISSYQYAMYHLLTSCCLLGKDVLAGKREHCSNSANRECELCGEYL